MSKLYMAMVRAYLRQNTVVFIHAKGKYYKNTDFILWRLC